MRALRLLAVVSALIFGCSAESPNQGGGRPAAGGSGSDPFGNSGMSSDGTAGSFGNPDSTLAGTTGGLPPTPTAGSSGGSDDSCGGQAYVAEGKPLDIYVIMDESASMIFPIDIWGPVTQALNQFFMSPDTAGISVGIQFFSALCDVSAYATPVVPIGELPGNAQALSSAMAARLPGPGTATTPALEGAIQHASQRQAQMPDRKVVVLLVTDGEPVSCGSDVNTTSAAAAAGLSASPSIPTYVLGLGNVGGLDQMAMAGGTNNAFVVSDPGQVQAVVDAMNSIRASALPCEYSVPDSSGTFDKSLVNLDWTREGTLTTVPYVGNQASCDATRGGWYYDSDETPTQLIACAKTCDDFKGGGNVDIRLGCPQQLLE
jgi:hypothetical protein